MIFFVDKDDARLYLINVSIEGVCWSLALPVVVRDRAGYMVYVCEWVLSQDSFGERYVPGTSFSCVSFECASVGVYRASFVRGFAIFRWTNMITV